MPASRAQPATPGAPAGYPEATPPPGSTPAPPATTPAPPPPGGPGAPPPQGYPPPANNYPPPSQGYPPPANNYPPPQGYPPGYAPPGYGQPPPYGYGPPPPQEPRRHRGFLAMPFLGIHSSRGDAGEGLDAGARLGVLLGGRLNGQFSLNGEMTFDVLNPSNVPSGVDYTGIELDFAFSPLVHIYTEAVELVLGPKLGGWAAAQQISSGGLTAKQRASGAVFGLNAGLFIPVNDGMSVGGLASVAVRSVSEICSTDPGSTEVCFSDPDVDAEKIVSLSAGLLF